MLREIEGRAGIKTEAVAKDVLYDVLFVLNGCMTACAKAESLRAERVIRINRRPTEKEMEELCNICTEISGNAKQTRRREG